MEKEPTNIILGEPASHLEAWMKELVVKEPVDTRKVDNCWYGIYAEKCTYDSILEIQRRVPGLHAAHSIEVGDKFDLDHILFYNGHVMFLDTKCWAKESKWILEKSPLPHIYRAKRCHSKDSTSSAPYDKEIQVSLNKEVALLLSKSNTAELAQTCSRNLVVHPSVTVIDTLLFNDPARPGLLHSDKLPVQIMQWMLWTHSNPVADHQFMWRLMAHVESLVEKKSQVSVDLRLR